MELLYGLHPVEEAIRSGSRRLEYVILSNERAARADKRQDRPDDRLARIAELCRVAGVRVSTQPKEQLTRLAGTDMHQGAVAAVKERQFLTIEDLLNAKPKYSSRFFLALDGVEDPHNLGALLRSADGAGIDGVLIPERRSAPISGVVAKTSAGASEHVKIGRVTNLVRSLEQMKKNNIWVLGLDERGTPDYTDFDFNRDCVLVLGSEGPGLHELTRKTCDHLLRIPMAGSVASLNVSVAGAVVMYEALRQRSKPLPTVPKPVKPRKGLGS